MTFQVSYMRTYYLTYSIGKLRDNFISIIACKGITILHRIGMIPAVSHIKFAYALVKEGVCFQINSIYNFFRISKYFKFVIRL